jgi:hypothetical protein
MAGQRFRGSSGFVQVRIREWMGPLAATEIVVVGRETLADIWIPISPANGTAVGSLPAGQSGEAI